MAESHRQESLETVLSRGSLPRHGSAGATEVIGYEE